MISSFFRFFPHIRACAIFQPTFYQRNSFTKHTTWLEWLNSAVPSAITSWYLDECREVFCLIVGARIDLKLCDKTASLTINYHTYFSYLAHFHDECVVRKFFQRRKSTRSCNTCTLQWVIKKYLKQEKKKTTLLDIPVKKGKAGWVVTVAASSNTFELRLCSV